MTRMTVNGEAIHYKLDPETPLLWALRDASNLTGTKYGCDSQDCGACTVIVDGRAVAELQRDASPRSKAPRSPPSRDCRPTARIRCSRRGSAEQVSQCGYCEPGFIMAIAALLQASPSPSEEQIAALPNICRCGAYPRIRKAIARAAASARPIPGQSRPKS